MSTPRPVHRTVAKNVTSKAAKSGVKRRVNTGAMFSTTLCFASTSQEAIRTAPAAPQGSSHDPMNVRLQCSACHLALHRGTLAITTTASGKLATRRCNEPPSIASGKLDATIVRAQARDALVGLGWKPSIARAAVDDAWSHVGCDQEIRG
jgi:hypothetical protein